MKNIFLGIVAFTLAIVVVIAPVVMAQPVTPSNGSLNPVSGSTGVFSTSVDSPTGNFTFVDAGFVRVDSAGTVASIELPTDCIVFGVGPLGTSCTATNGWAIWGDGSAFNVYYGNQSRLANNVGSGAWSTPYAFSAAGTVSSSIASGSNAFSVSTNGARIDYGAGALDYFDSDGTTVTAHNSFQTNGTLGQVMGSTSSYASSVGVANSNMTPVASAGNATTLISYTLPANALVVSTRCLRITGWGHVTNNANAKTVSLAFGGQTIITKALTPNIAIEVWKLTANVCRTGASTQEIFAEAWNEAGTTVSSVDGATTLYQATRTAGTQTETATIVIKGVATTATTTDITQDGMVVEFL